MRPTVSTTLLLSLLLSAVTMAAQGPSVLRDLQPPEGQVLIAHLAGKGQQIYSCQNTAGVYAWKLKAPDARLFDQHGELAGRHFAGPTWESTDGSRVLGKLIISVASPDPASIPWLLLTAKSNEGAGLMAKVQSIQRLDTKGGVAPPTGCGAPDENKEIRVPYQATYNFYGSTPSASTH